jgi:hypothetical protein
MNIHVCHSKTMSHPFEYLRYRILINIIHMNHNMEFMWFLYKPRKPNFAQNLYNPMKHGKFVMQILSIKLLCNLLVNICMASNAFWHEEWTSNIPISSQQNIHDNLSKMNLQCTMTNEHSFVQTENMLPKVQGVCQWY